MKTLRLIHLTNVVLLIVLYSTAYYRSLFTTQSESQNWYFLVIHMNLGVAVFILTLAAIVIKIRHTMSENRMALPYQQNNAINNRGHHFLSQAMHWTLYSLMLFMPLAAYAGIGFDLPLLGGLITIDNPSRYEFLDQLSRSLLDLSYLSASQPLFYFHVDWGAELLIPILLVGHISAALYHHLILRDDTLKYMFLFRNRN